MTPWRWPKSAPYASLEEGHSVVEARSRWPYTAAAYGSRDRQMRKRRPRCSGYRITRLGGDMVRFSNRSAAVRLYQGNMTRLLDLRVKSIHALLEGTVGVHPSLRQRTLLGCVTSRGGLTMQERGFIPTRVVFYLVPLRPTLRVALKAASSIAFQSSAPGGLKSRKVACSSFTPACSILHTMRVFAGTQQRTVRRRRSGHQGAPAPAVSSRHRRQLQGFQRLWHRRWGS